MESLTTVMLGLLVAQLGITEEAAAELLFEQSDEGTIDRTKVKEGALDTLLAKDVDRVEKLKGAVDKTKIYTKAYDDAKVKILPQVEKKLAAEYGITLDGQKLPELVKAIVEQQVTAAGKTVNDETVKKHPLYLSLERTKTEEIESLNTNHETAINDLKAGFEKSGTLNSVRDLASTYFAELNPVLSKDAAKAANQIKRFVSQFDAFDYQKEGDDFILLGEDGNRLEDNHGQPIFLKSKVSNLASSEFDFAVQDNKGGGGNNNNAGGGVQVPADENAYNEAIFGASSPEERTAIKEAYVAAGGQA